MASDSNKSSLALQKETAWGVAPASPALKLLRFTGEDLKATKDTVTSEEIRPDRAVPDLAMVGKSAGGSFSFELSYTGFQGLFASMLQSGIVAVNIPTLTCALAAAGQTVTAVTGSWATVQAGSFIRIVGAAVAANNGIKAVLSKTATALTLAAGSIASDEASPALTITTNTVKNGTTRDSYFFERGVPKVPTGTAYQQFLGMSPDTLDLTVESKKIITAKMAFVGSYGATADTSLMYTTGAAAVAVLTLSGNAVAGETFTFHGKTYTWRASPTTVANEVKVGVDAATSIANADAAIRGLAGSGSLYGSLTVPAITFSTVATATTLTATATTRGVLGNAYPSTETMTNGSFGAATFTGGVDPTANVPADTDPVVNGTTNMGVLSLDSTGANTSEHFKTISLSIKNNIRALDALANTGAFDLGTGRFEVEGKVSAFFRDNTTMAAFLAHTYLRFSFSVQDSLGNVIGITLPRVNFSDANTAIKKMNDDNMLDGTFTSIYDPASDAVMIVSFVPHL